MSLLLDLIFPSTCSGCGHVGCYLCERCKSTLTHKGIRTQHKAPVDGSLSLFRYKGAIKQLITDLKFKFVTGIVDELADLMVYTLINNYPHLLRYWQENKFVLVPVPLHSQRQAWRGFNQSELICQRLSEKLCLEYNPRLLVRTRYTSPQTSISDKRLRKINTQSSFSLTVKHCPTNLILFDDVYTTGSTAKSAISALSGHETVWVLTVAG